MEWLNRKPELGGEVGSGVGEVGLSIVGVAQRRGPEKTNPELWGKLTVRGRHRKRTSAEELQKGRGGDGERD